MVARKTFEAYDMFSVEDVMREDDLYVEIGAHRGRFLTESKLLRAACRYRLYEPNPRERTLLDALFHGYDVVVYPEAVWGKPGSFAYFVDDHEGQGNTLVSGVHEARAPYRVPAITLAQVVDRHGPIRFLAVNAEQAEYEILRSPAMARVDYVTVEFHPGKSGIDTKAILREVLPTFETLCFGREGDAYNQWVGRRKGAQ